MAHDLATWLQQMPPEAEIEERIKALEQELELLSALRRVREFSGQQSANEADGEPGPSLEELRKRMSQERLRILRVIVAAPERRSGIMSVAGALKLDRENVASNMQRMVAAKLLERVGHGLYAATPGAVKLVEEAAVTSDRGYQI